MVLGTLSSEGSREECRTIPIIYTFGTFLPRCAKQNPKIVAARVSRPIRELLPGANLAMAVVNRFVATSSREPPLGSGKGKHRGQIICRYFWMVGSE